MEPSGLIPWPQLSGLIADTIGLHYPRERWPDLQRGLKEAALDFGFGHVAECVDWLLSQPLSRDQVQVLANHLTIGETYFFRDKKTFEALAVGILPELIRSRRGRDQRLRLWSAACCSGEEAYSLAILLQQVLPDPADWQVSILGTDINANFLRKAVAGSYGEWSFREAPPGFKERYFHRDAAGRFVVAPEIKRSVAFAHLNLVEDLYPSPATDTNSMDLILCRNTLMYFTSTQARKVIGNLHRALVDGGSLAVSPSEASQALFSRFITRNFPGTILYEKNETPRAGLPASDLSVSPPDVPKEKIPLIPPPPDLPSFLWSQQPAAVESRNSAPAEATTLCEPGGGEEAASTLLALAAAPSPDPSTFSQLARLMADQGKLDDALQWCDRWIANDKLDACGHYLRAVVLLERGNVDEAHGSLLRAIYLDPELVLAHYALGNLARAGNKFSEAEKHFTNALRLLAPYQPTDVLPQSDGLTAGRLTETITAMIGLENVR